MSNYYNQTNLKNQPINELRTFKTKYYFQKAFDLNKGGGR